MSPSTPTTIGTVDVFISHIFVTSISRSLYLDSFSTSLIDTFLSDVNHNAFLFYLVFDNYVWSVSFYLFARIYRPVP